MSSENVEVVEPSAAPELPDDRGEEPPTGFAAALSARSRRRMRLPAEEDMFET